VSKAQTQDPRFTVPRYTVSEAARFLGVKPRTFSHWARGYEVHFPDRKPVQKGPIITAFASRGREPSIPFIGLTEGLVVAAFRRTGVSLQHIRRAVEILSSEIGIDHALASRKLYTDGASVLYDYAEQHGDEELTHVVTPQRVFAPVVAEYLQLITRDDEGWPRRVTSPTTDAVVVDPVRAFGQPIFVRGAVRVEDVLDRIRAGERFADVADDFGVPIEDVEAVVRVELRLAA
jgi:uncharacterized protein (DUF433 family)/DNA-binding transcriptional MerR regulator